MQHQGTPLPPASAIEYLTQKDETDIASGFYAFGVTTDSAHAGASTNQGMFVVDKQTGDIWEFNVCRRYRFAQLLNAQKIVMQATGKWLGSARQVRAKLGCVAAHR